MTEEEKYKNFFDKIEKFKIKQTQQKQRGLNNYNLLTSVLQPHDEVRLHSRIIFSLLNPNGEHFQDTLFLEKFLEILEINDFKLSSWYVYKEYEKIDLYITDGKLHIIIENKLYASDQKEQIKRYVEVIQKENEQKNKCLQADDILVVYLSLNGKNPSKYSLGDLTVDGNYLKRDGENITKYKSIDYKKDILHWLQKCQYEVQNITNINEAIRQYTDVVKIVTNQYKDKIMNLSDYIKENKSIYKIAIEVKHALPEVRKSAIKEFFSNIKKLLETELGEKWTVKLIEDNLSKRWNFPLRIYKKEWIDSNENNLIFGFEFDRDNYYKGTFGVVRQSEKVDIKKDITNKFEKEFNQIKIKLNTTDWYIHWERLPIIDDFAEYVILNEDAERKFLDKVKNFIDIFEHENQLITKINKYLLEPKHGV